MDSIFYLVTHSTWSVMSKQGRRDWYRIHTLDGGIMSSTLHHALCSYLHGEVYSIWDRLLNKGD